MGILFITKIKSNIKHGIITMIGNSKNIRLSDGYTLSSVTIKKGKDDFEYITNIYDLPDEYIEEKYGRD